MKKIVFIGSHLGYPMDRTPLGGGAMVGLELVRHWRGKPGFELTVLGSGPEAPAPGIEYRRLAAPEAPGGLVSLSELEYAAFCRRFEAASTEWLLKESPRFPPESTCVVVNDISEGPTLQALARAGYPIVSLWHVDVVDYFNKLYLRHVVKPERLTRLYERARRLGFSWALPDLLKLIFEKQRETVVHSRRMIMPSRAMAETVSACYGDLLESPEEFSRRAAVIPWGGWDEEIPEEDIAREAGKLKKSYRISPETMVVTTLSRISPEKGIHLLIEALRLLEERGRFAAQDVCLFVCGEPAFMQGAAYHDRVKQAAAALKKVRVFFPGYLASVQKQAHFRLTNLFVSPSIHESYGLNVVEAMRAGLPVLASDHYGVRDLLKESFGRRVHYPSPAKAPPRLAEVLDELLADRACLARMGEAARQAAAGMPFSKAAEAVLDAALSLIAEGKKEGAVL